MALVVQSQSLLVRATLVGVVLWALLLEPPLGTPTAETCRLRLGPPLGALPMAVLSLSRLVTAILRLVVPSPSRLVQES
jgi:hypothetical protein